MLLEPITRTMTKTGLIIICTYNLTMAQSQQVTLELTMMFDIPYVGPINRVEKITLDQICDIQLKTQKLSVFMRACL